MIVPRLWELLQGLHTRLLTHHTTLTRSYQKGRSVALGTFATSRIQTPKGVVHLLPSSPQPRP
jgi:hypothetical protein